MKKSLRKIRIENGLSQYELAFASGVPRYVIQLAESEVRVPTEEQQKCLASALGILIDELFPSQKEMNSKKGNSNAAE